MNEPIKQGTTTGDTEQVPTPSDSRHGRLRGWGDWWFHKQRGRNDDISCQRNCAVVQDGPLVGIGERGGVSSPTWREQTTIFIKRSAAASIKPVGTQCYDAEVYNRWSKVMLWIAFVLGLVMLACGCTSTNVKWKDVSVNRTSLFTRSQADVEWTSPDGTKVVVKAKSNPELEALKEGLQTGFELGKALAK